jgi:predicted anti-sigma-YlaC factor YlaD
MDCTSAREGLSARLDGEVGPVESAELDAHLDRCSGCRSWTLAVVNVNRRVRLRPLHATADLSERVLSGVRARSVPVTAWPPERWLLLGLGAVMLIIAVPMALGVEDAAELHVVREAGVTELALAVGVLFAAVQPWRAAGMLPVVIVLAAGLTLTSAADILHARVAPAQELLHLLAPMAALLLWRLRRRGPVRPTAPGERALRPLSQQDDRRSA